MTQVSFRRLHPSVGAEVSAMDLRNITDRSTLDRLRDGMDEYAVLVFRDQPFTDAEQLAFAQRFDGQSIRKPECRRSAGIASAMRRSRIFRTSMRAVRFAVRKIAGACTHSRTVYGIPMPLFRSPPAAIRCCPRASCRRSERTRNLRTCAQPTTRLMMRRKTRSGI